MKLRLKTVGAFYKGFCWGGGHTFSNAVTENVREFDSVNFSVFSRGLSHFKVEILYFSSEGVVFMIGS